MQNYHDLGTDTLVARAGSLNAISALSMPRGNVSFGVQFCNGSANAALPTGSTVYFGLKSQAAPKGAWLALAQLLPITGSPGLYQAILPLNTPEMIAATHADPADPTQEILDYPTYGELHYFLPGNIEPNFSQKVNVNVSAVLWNGAEAVAASPTTLALALALAGTALQPGQEDTWTFNASDPTAGDFSIVGAPCALLFGSAQDQDGNSVVPVVVSSAHNVTSFQCTSTLIFTLGRLPAGLVNLDVTSTTFAYPTAEIASICAQLVANGVHFGYLYLSGCGAPNIAALANIDILNSRDWIIYHD